MNQKKLAITTTVIALLVISLSASFILTDEVFAKKSCESKSWSHCKGTKGWYTEKGHHHCFKGNKGCVKENGSHNHYHS